VHDPGPGGGLQRVHDPGPGGGLQRVHDPGPGGGLQRVHDPGPGGVLLSSFSSRIVTVISMISPNAAAARRTYADFQLDTHLAAYSYCRSIDRFREGRCSAPIVATQGPRVQRLCL
jgi:hypothetical protein